ncbi:MAG: ATP-binding protein [Acidobacteriota bacterium]
MKQFAEFCLDTAEECLWRRGARIELAPKPFAVLRYLVEKAGHLVTHDELLDALWPETYVQPQVLRTYMLDLRRVLGDDAREPRFIESVPKRGYRFIAAVREANGPEIVAHDQPLSNAHKLMGRERELRLLADHLGKARGGTRQIVFLRGEAGIGKTALIEAFCHDAQGTQDARVGLAQCLQGFAARQDYYPVLEALGHICTTATEREHVTSRAPGWMSVSSADDARAGSSCPPGDLCATFEALAQDRPLVLVFEDVQWADDATLELIAALARRRGTAKLLVLASFTQPCPVSAQRLRALTQDLTMRRLATEIALSRLGRAALAALLHARLDARELPAALIELIHMRSEGNALFAIMLLDHFVAEGLLRQQCGEGTWQLRGEFEQIETSLPRELAEMIELELERLDAREQRLLEAGSLISIAFPAWAVAAALEQDLAETEESCEELARRFALFKRAGVDELPDGTQSNFYAFRHGLYREALYQRQPAARRAERHVRIAERLRSLFPGREDLIAGQAAMHYEAACDWRRATEILRLGEQQAKAKRSKSLADELHERAEFAAAQWMMRQADGTFCALPCN